MRKGFIVAALGLVVLAVLAIGAFAYGRQGTQQGAQTPVQGAYHEEMQGILENGTYAGLVALREETGRPMMPWVTDEASFVVLQEHHRQMVALSGDKQRFGMRGAVGNGRGGRGGCPMMDAD
jgi:hypothetical protein